MKLTKKELFFFIGTILLMLKTWGAISNYINFSIYIDKVLLFSSYICYIGSMFFDKKYTLGELVKNAIFLGVGIITYYYSKYTDFMTIIVIYISSKNVNMKKLIKIMFIINILLIFLHMAVYIVLIIFNNDMIILSRYINGKDIYRYSFGFAHPNTFGTVFFWTIAMYYYLNFELIGTKDYIITFILAIFIYKVPNSRTSAMALIGMVILMILTKKNILKYRIVNILYLGVLLICILSIFNIDNKIISFIDKSINNRFTLAYIIYKENSIPLLGQNISGGISTYMNGNYYNNINIIDNSYLALLLNYGIIAFIIFNIFMEKLLRHAKNKKEIVFLVIWTFFAISETVCLMPMIAFPLLWLNNNEVLEKNSIIN